MIKMTVPQADWCSQANAERLARQIERYWREKIPGCHITCWVEPVKNSVGGEYRNIWAVRSTMLNGRPQVSNMIEFRRRREMAL